MSKYYKSLQEHPSPIESINAHQSEDEANINPQHLNQDISFGSETQVAQIPGEAQAIKVKDHLYKLYTKQRYQTPDPRTDYSVAVNIQSKADTTNRMLAGFTNPKNKDKNSVTMQFSNND